MPEITYRHLSVLLAKNTFYHLKKLTMQSVTVKNWRCLYGEEIQRILIALKEAEKQKNNDLRKTYYIF